MYWHAFTRALFAPELKQAVLVLVVVLVVVVTRRQPEKLLEAPVEAPVVREAHPRPPWKARPSESVESGPRQLQKDFKCGENLSPRNAPVANPQQPCTSWRRMNMNLL